MMNNGKKEEIIINTQDQDKKQNIDNILVESIWQYYHC